MRFNKNNIGDYIDFLHIKKHHYPADPSLRGKWEQLPEDTMQAKLNQLYHHWNITESEGRQYEADFARTQTTATASHTTYPPPSTPPPYQATPVDATYVPPSQGVHPYNSALPPRRKNYTLPILLILLILVGGAFAFYYFVNQFNDGPASDNDASVLTTRDGNNREATATVDLTTNAPTHNVSEEVATAAREAEVAAASAKKQARIDAITTLLKAEQDRDLAVILSTFASSPVQYWDKKNPTQEDLKNLYYKTWSNTGEQSYSNVNIQKIDEQTYELTADYTYYSIKDDVEKNVPLRTRYIFDDNNKIIKTFGVKK